jgi:hypothetical protein
MEYQLANEIIEYVRSDDCCRLNYEKLGCLLELIIYNEKVVNILKKTPINNCDVAIYFNQQYDNFINKKRNFILLKNPIEDLALSWLCCLYH